MPSWRRMLEAVAEAWDEQARRDPRGLRARRASACRAAPRSSPPTELLEPALARRGRRRAAGELRHRQRRLRRRAEVPARVGARVPAAPRRDGDDRPHAARDGVGRDVRPDRRRLRPLLGRRALARPPLREDALRQRAARPRLPARLAGHRRAALPARCARRRSTGRCARCAATRAASTPRSTRTPRARRASSTSGRSTSCARWAATRPVAGLRRHRRGQLRGHQHPRAQPARPRRS